MKTSIYAMFFFCVLSPDEYPSRSAIHRNYSLIILKLEHSRDSIHRGRRLSHVFVCRSYFHTSVQRHAAVMSVKLPELFSYRFPRWSFVVFGRTTVALFIIVERAQFLFQSIRFGEEKLFARRTHNISDDFPSDPVVAAAPGRRCVFLHFFDQPRPRLPIT